MKNNYEIYLLNKFSYYDKLSFQMRIKFLLRVKNFITDKSFEKKGDFEITDEMKTLIAASAIQVTFGLDSYKFDYFETIVILPDSYYSNLTNHYHMGEVSLNGVIIISWKDFINGYSNPSDTYNVGLHEMAHALDFEQKLDDGDFDFYFGNYFDKWALIAKAEYENIHNERASFLRKYAGTNEREFFAVCVESFFEAPEQFKEKLPQIYHHLCILLNQDPMNVDFKLIQQPKRNIEELTSEMQSSLELFNSGFKIKPFSIFFSLVMFSLVFYQFSTAKLGLYSFIIIIPFIIIISIDTIHNSNRFILFNDIMVIKNAFGRIKNIYSFDDLVAVAFGYNRGGGYISILVLDKGKIHRNVYSYITSDENINKLKELLTKNNIIVKDDNQ